MNDDDQREWTGLFKLGALSALIIVIVFFVEIVVIVFYGLPPTSVEGWFALLNANRAVGLIQTFALDVIAVSFHAPLYLALFFYLREGQKGAATLLVAVTLALIGMAVFFSTNITFSMLYLSGQYASAASPEQKAQFVISGQTLLSIYNGTGPFVAYLFYAVAGILVSIVMLQTRRFAMWVGIAGIIGNVLELGLPPALNPPFFMQIDPFLIGIGGVILLFWYVAIAVKFYSQKARTKPAQALSGAIH
ncbi:MAG TPA: hypothetical protein VMT46_03955 [Anaerolineaceae bacterium]|nr:hypothetical protein [Anaerolineaceae bacterium]